MKRLSLALRPPALPAAWTARLQAARDAARGQWVRMTDRERRLVRALGVVLATAAIFLLAVRPAWRDIARWQDELPRLRAQAATVDALVQEAQALRRSQAARVPLSAMEDELRASLERAGLGDSHRIASREDGRSWDVEFENIPTGALFDWLMHGPSLLRLRLEQAHIERPRDALGKPAAARASATVRLRAPEDAGGDDAVPGTAVRETAAANAAAPYASAANAAAYEAATLNAAAAEAAAPEAAAPNAAVRETSARAGAVPEAAGREASPADGAAP